ncbi:MAG TPA: hypothetical protein VJB99_04105 [Patescibacteria group bacterium]|nr:hypothetical protein [Patescibacteria group bacterium]
MKWYRFLSLLLSFSFVLPNIPAVRAATTTQEIYAQAVYQASNEAYAPQEAIGVPDGSFLQFLDKDANVILDFGEGSKGIGGVTLTYTTLAFGATYRIDYLDANLTNLETVSAVFPTGETERVISFTGSSPYRYVRVTSAEDEVWKLDAVKATVEIIPQTASESPLAEGTVTAEPTETSGTTSESTVSSSLRGLLVRLPDESAVYVLDGEERRHAFPHWDIYRTWWDDGEDVAFIDSFHLFLYPLKGNVGVRPGTYLVKRASDPKVYVVEPGNVLRWIETEEIAKTLYGTDWAKRILDLPDATFADYTIGSSLSSAGAYPSGTLGYLPSTGRVVYLWNGKMYNLPGDTLDTMRFQTRFMIKLTESATSSFVDGGDLPLDSSIRFPF